MCAMASSTLPTSLTLMMGARYSVDQSSSVASSSFAPLTPASSAFAPASHRISTPLAANTAPMRGRNAGATASCTSSDSAALQGLYFCVLALSVTVTARSRSTSASTYTWQLPSRCLITGTRASALMRSIRPLPPRGMITSTYSGIAISRPTAARSVVSTSCTASRGRPASASASCTHCHKARFECSASEPPRRMQALPLLMASEAASIVTLGRLSYTMPNTPSGTRICPTLMPEGRRFTFVISPTGSGIAAICSQPSATVSITLSVRRRRSTIGAARPPASAAAMSRALAACSCGFVARNRAARFSSAAFFAAVEAAAMAVAAARAATPTWAM